MKNARAIMVGVVMAALFATGCSAFGSDNTEATPAQSPSAEEAIVVPVTGWQSEKSPGNDTRYYRIVRINTPDGSRLCALQVDGGTMGSGSSFTMLGAGNSACNKHK